MSSLKYFFSFLLIYISSNAVAQILKITSDNAIQLPIYFNEIFIKDNKIKSITANLAVKPDNKPIEDKGLINTTEFDSLGRVCKYFYTRIKSKTETEQEIRAVRNKRGKIVRPAYTKVDVAYSYDTVVTWFYYNSKNAISIKRTLDDAIYDSRYFDYDSLGNCIKIIHARETSSSKSDFKLMSQTILSIENFKYENLSSTQIKKYYLNEEGRTYRTSIINYDNSNNKIDENNEFIVTWLVVKESFKYNASNEIIEKNYFSNTGEEVSEKVEIEYDTNQNVSLEKHYKNNIKTNEYSYLYDENNKFLKSQLNRNFTNSTIGIIKLSYSFWK